MKKLINSQRMETSVWANDRNGCKVRVDRFEKAGTTATGRTVARAEMNEMRIWMIANAVPEKLIFVVNERELIDWVIRT
jgi:hypothetical protein